VGGTTGKCNCATVQLCNCARGGQGTKDRQWESVESKGREAAKCTATILVCPGVYMMPSAQRPVFPVVPVNPP